MIYNNLLRAFFALPVMAMATAYAQSSSGGTHQSLPPEIRKEIDRKLKVSSELAQHAKALFDQGKYAEAQSEAELGIRLYGDDVRFEAVIGESLLRRGKSREALEAFKKINASQSDAASYARIGLLRLQLGDEEGSRAMLKDELVASFLSASSMRSLPDVTDRRTLEGAWDLVIGLIEDSQADDVNALSYYRKALILLPENPLLNFNLGKIYLRQRRYADSTKAFSIAVKHGKGEIVKDADRELSTARRLLSAQQEREGASTKSGG